MTPKQLTGVQGRLDEFLEDLIEPIGRSDGRHWAGGYVQGLLVDGERKSVQPMAARLAGADEQALNQFLNQSPWAVTEIQQRLAHPLGEAGHEPVCWMVDETSFPKAGEHSVGAARQYCGTLGKSANCQVAVSLHWRQDQLSDPMSWRLYLPRAWCEDSARRAEAHIPKEVVYPTKTDLALEVINQAIAWDVPREPCSQIRLTATISPFARRCEATSRSCRRTGTDNGSLDGSSQPSARADEGEDRSPPTVSQSARYATGDLA